MEKTKKIIVRISRDNDLLKVADEIRNVKGVDKIRFTYNE